DQSADRRGVRRARGHGSPVAQRLRARRRGGAEGQGGRNVSGIQYGKCGRQDLGPHRVTSGGIARCLNGKSSIETTSITTGFLRVFRTKKPPLHRRETSIETDELKYTKLWDLTAASSPKMK